MILILFPFFAMISIRAHTQATAWNQSSFQFSRDSITPEDMSGATSIKFTGSMPLSSSVIAFAGFSFRYGLKSYQQFFISPYGFIKLGNAIISRDPSNDTSVIVPLFNGTEWDASYKIVGAAPKRKLVVQFSGVMQPSGEPTFFQVWLYEKSGKIQFVYSHLRGFYNYGEIWNYKIFCAANILNQRTIASLGVQANNALPTISYSGSLSSFDSISTNTRFTFQPDTLKPTAPTLLNFSNVHASSLAVHISESANNETVIALERTDNSTGYLIKKLFYPETSIGVKQYTYDQSSLRPFFDYTYRVYLSNGFVNSDTVYSSIKTLLPELNGVIKIPGDYHSLTSLLEDAVNKQFGKNVVIELQKNYSYQSETFPIIFGPALQNRFNQSIVIRPAIDANITWVDSTSLNRPIFYVDSVKHVFIDGRPGGKGSSRNFTIYQRNPTAVIIQYTNAADSGGIRYSNLIKKGSKYSGSSIVVVPKNIDFSRDKRDINAFSITNNYISADSGTVQYLVNVRPSDPLQARDFVIANNLFSGFITSAIHFENGGENLKITGNSFFQPAPFNALVFLPYKSASCISLLNTGTAEINGNYFGGGSPVWGKGKFTLDIYSDDFSFIYYQNNSLTRKAIISNNKFGNIANNNLGGSPVMIVASGGNVLIDHNQLGTLDSANSITSKSYFWGISAGDGTKIISNNFFGGFRGGYQYEGSVNHSYFISTSSVDSLLIINNDIGGSNNIEANSSSGLIHGIYLLASTNKSITLRDNILHGISSTNSSVYAISGANGLSGKSTNKCLIDSNSIHHIQAASEVRGVDLNLNSNQINIISNNQIFALKTTGIIHGNYGPTGTIVGIKYSIYNYNLAPADYKGEVRIFGNKIHSFESIRKLPNSIFNQTGMNVGSPVSKIFNNEIRLGINSKGKYIDSLTTLTGIEIYPLDYQVRLSDKHYIEHNTIYFGGKGPVAAAISCRYADNYFSENNKITLTNNILDIDRIPVDGSKLSYQSFVYTYNINPQSASNIWYVKNDSKVADLVTQFKELCKCDSSSFTGNPVFINPDGDSSNYDLHLGALSKANDAGYSPVLNISKDLDDNDRNLFSPVDIGCYASVPCGNGNLSSISITNPSSDTTFLCGQEGLTLKSIYSKDLVFDIQWQKNLINIPGSNADSLVLDSGVSGEYRLTGKTTCGTVSSRIIYVLRDSLDPKVSIFNPPNKICSNETAGFSAFAHNEGDSPSYQWLLNGIIQESDSSIFWSSTIKNQDTLKVILTSNACGFLSTTESEPVTVQVIQAPVAIAGRDTTICAGASVQVGNSNYVSNVSYEWYPTRGLSNPFIRNPISTPNTTTSYAVTIRGQGNCDSKDTVVITVLPQLDNPIISISTPDSIICEGQSVTFTATMVNEGSNPVIHWQVNGVDAGSNSNTFTTEILKNNDRVTAILTSDSKCVVNNKATSNAITLQVGSLAAPKIVVSGSYLSVLNAEPGISYAWQILQNGVWNDIVPLASGDSLNVLSTGIYRVRANKLVCMAYSDSISLIVSLRTRSDNPYGIYLYPNPTNKMILIDSLYAIYKWETLNVIDVNGRQTLPVKNIRGQDAVSLDVGGLGKGIYFIQITSADGKITKLKFIKL